MAHMQNVLYAEDLPKSNSLFAINDDDDYFDELDTEAEYSDLLLGTLATSYDLMGKMAICLCSDKSNPNLPNIQKVLGSVNILFKTLSKPEKKAIREAVKFHYSSTETNNNSGLVPIWRDMYPISNLSKLNFDNVINSYK